MARFFVAVVLGLIVVMLPGEAGDETASKSGVAFLLTPYAPVVPSIKDLYFQLIQSWNRQGKLVVHSAEWEIRKDGNQRVARVPAHEYFYDENGTHDARPPHPEGSRGDFSEDELRQIGNLEPGNYRMALLINGVRASNVIAFKIDPAFDMVKSLS